MDESSHDGGGRAAKFYGPGGQMSLAGAAARGSPGVERLVTQADPTNITMNFRVAGVEQRMTTESDAAAWSGLIHGFGQVL